MKFKNMAKKYGTAIVVSTMAAAPAFANTGPDVTEAVAVIGGFTATAIILGIAYIKLTATKTGLRKLGG